MSLFGNVVTASGMSLEGHGKNPGSEGRSPPTPSTFDCQIAYPCNKATEPVKVRGDWRYLYRAIDSNGDTVEFWFSERRNLAAAKRFLRKALERHGRPERIVIDGSQTNREAILSCDTTDRLRDQSRGQLKPIRIRQSAYLNNRIEQDHRAVKRRVRPMLGFKSMASAQAILSGIEMVHMMRKQQAKYACKQQLSLAEQFYLIAA
jgi:transposase-like protein